VPRRYCARQGAAGARRDEDRHRTEECIMRFTALIACIMLAGCPAVPKDVMRPPPCSGTGQNTSDCEIKVFVEEATASNPQCTVKIASDQMVVRFKIMASAPKWILWRLDSSAPSSNYKFKTNGGIEFKDDDAPFSDGHPQDQGSVFAVKNKGKKNPTSPTAEDYYYGVHLVHRTDSKVKCGFDPLIKNE
jgi:hypothetical protein